MQRQILHHLARDAARARHKFAAAIGAAVIHCVCAVLAEGTFIRTNPRPGAVLRKRIAAAFTCFPHFKRHDNLVLRLRFDLGNQHIRECLYHARQSALAQYNDIYGRVAEWRFRQSDRPDFSTPHLSRNGPYRKDGAAGAAADEIAQRLEYIARQHWRDPDLLAPNLPQQLAFRGGRLTGAKFEHGSRLVMVISAVRQPNIEINYGTGKDASRETIADAKTPLDIHWLTSSEIDIPVRE